MVHTFETLATQRKLADQERAKERAWALQQQQQWEREQLQLRQSKYMPTLTSAVHTTTYTYDTPTHASRASQHGTSNSKYHQLKRKSHESRQRLIQLSKEQLLAAFDSHADKSEKRQPATSASKKLANSYSAQTLAIESNSKALTTDGSPHKRQRTLSLRSANATRSPNGDDDLAQQYGHMDDDYRKNLFGTLASRGHAPTLQLTMNSGNGMGGYAKGNAPYNSLRGSQEDGDFGVSNDLNAENDDEAIIVNAAFDEIFAGYSGADDDEEEYNVGNSEEQMVSLSELDDDVFKSLGASQINNLGCPGNTPMKFPLIAVGAQKKAPPPPPPPPLTATAHTPSIKNIDIKLSTPSTKRKHTIMPLAKQKQRSTTLHNLFDRLKATQTKVKRPFTKISSDSLLKQDQLNIEQMTHALHKYPPQLDLYREVGEGKAADERTVCNDADAADDDFLRGSTLSQSFVRQLHMRQDKEKAKKKMPAPAPPITSKLQSNSASGVNAVNGAPRPHLSQWRTKSSNELLLDDLAIQARRYQRAASRKYPAPATPKKQQPPMLGQVMKVADAGEEALRSYKQNRDSSRGHGVGADTTRSERNEYGSFLRGSAEI
ncbi:uncharacterized protein LOC128871586 [Anastrepha ludens]|uniref:uncharacterized protein LOC128871586 n=1 Tax=Anastrepha ludens TaxID=28586 RepID=UPI0023B04ED8|nr:uncharacterized protein LOC128871586 [Anastrepha ludens]